MTSFVSEIDIFVSSTGNFNIITLDKMKKLESNAFIGNTGHSDCLRTMPALFSITGFGRIGMLVFRAESANPDVQRPLHPSRLHGLPAQVRQCPRPVQRHHRDV